MSKGVQGTAMPCATIANCGFAQQFVPYGFAARGPELNGAPVGHSPKAKVKRRPSERGSARHGSAAHDYRKLWAGGPERATGKSAGGAELKRCPGGAFAVGESEAEAW